MDIIFKEDDVILELFLLLYILVCLEDNGMAKIF